MAAIRQEGRAEKEGTCTNGDKEELSRDWVIENFRLQDNPITKDNPEVGEDLIRVLQKRGQAFEG